MPSRTVGLMHVGYDAYRGTDGSDQHPACLLEDCDSCACSVDRLIPARCWNIRGTEMDQLT